MQTTRREFVKSSVATALAIAAGDQVAQRGADRVDFDFVGLCAPVVKGNAATVGLINETYFTQLGLTGHVPELGLPIGSYSNAEPDAGDPAAAQNDVARWRNDQAHTTVAYQKWTLKGRRLEIETSSTGFRSAVARTARIRQAWAAAGFEPEQLAANWETDAARVWGTVVLKAGHLSDGKERLKNYKHKFHSGRWIYQPYLPGRTPVRQNNLNDAFKHSVGDVTAIVLYGLADNEVKARISLNSGIAVHAFVSNLLGDPTTQAPAPHIVHHARAYYALYDHLPRTASHELLMALPVPVGRIPADPPARFLGPRANGDVYCPGGTP